MKKSYTVQFILTISAILFASLGLNAQEPVATTADGKVVFLESDVKKFPAERQEAIRNLPRFIIIESRSDLDKIESEHGLKDHKDSESTADGKANRSSSDLSQIKEELDQMHKSGEISEQEYAERMKQVNKQAESQQAENQSQNTDSGNSSLNPDGDVPGSKTAQVTEGTDEPKENDEADVERDDVVSDEERALQEADSYEDLKRGKEEIREQIESGEMDVREGRMLIHQYNQAIKELSAGDGGINSTGKSKEGANTSTSPTPEKRVKDFNAELVEYRKQLFEQYENGEITKEEANNRYLQKRNELREKHNLSVREAEENSGEVQSQYNSDPQEDLEETKKDLPRGMTIEEYQNSDNDKTPRQLEKEKLEQEGYSDDEIQEMLQKDYPSR